MTSHSKFNILDDLEHQVIVSELKSSLKRSFNQQRSTAIRHKYELQRARTEHEVSLKRAKNDGIEAARVQKDLATRLESETVRLRQELESARAAVSAVQAECDDAELRAREKTKELDAMRQMKQLKSNEDLRRLAAGYEQENQV